MLRLFGCYLATNQQRLCRHREPIKKEISPHIAQLSLENVKKTFENLPTKMESGIFPYMPEPGDAEYEQWLELFEKAVEAIERASKRQKGS